MLSFKKYIGLQYHKRLNPLLFKDDVLKEPVRLHLIEIMKKFQEFCKIDQSWVLDYHLTGSNMNYNFNDALSDLDCHIFIDHTKVPEPDQFHNFIMLAKNEWAKNHPDIKVMGFPAECYAQLDNEFQPANQGVYSLCKNTWLIHPVWIDIKYNDPEFKKRLLSYDKAADDAIAANDLEKAKAIKNEITSARAIALQGKLGEFDISNIIFKAARNDGLLQKLTTFIQQSEDAALSYNKTRKHA